MSRLLLTLILLMSEPLLAIGDDSKAKATDWEKAYEQLLLDRPDIRKKVEIGGASKDDVIAWMKQGGDRQKQGQGKAYRGPQIQIKEPSRFRSAQASQIYSGPQPGEPLPPFKVTGFLGAKRGEVFDPVDLAAGKPLMLIFQDDSVVGQKGLLLCGKTLAKIAEESRQGFMISATFLVDDPTPSKVFQYKFADKIDKAIVMSVSHDRRDGPGAYGLNRNVAMTIILARDGKVTHNFVFPQSMLYPDPHVLGGIAELLGEEHETVLSWFSNQETKQDGMGAKPAKSASKK